MYKKGEIQRNRNHQKINRTPRAEKSNNQAEASFKSESTK